MNKHHRPPYRKAALYIATALPVLLLAAWIAGASREPKAIYADTKDNNSIYYSSNAYASQENAASAPINSKTVKNYTVRIQNGSISVFEDGNPLPLYTIDTPPERLPEADRLILNRGIRTESFEEACRLIEDYE